MVVAFNDKTIYLVAQSGDMFPTTPASHRYLQRLAGLDYIPQRIGFSIFPRIVAAGYKLAIENA